MKKPPALLPFLLAALILCLAVSPIQGALAQEQYPFAADALLYKNFVGELTRLNIKTTDSKCTTTLSELENGESAAICQYSPADSIYFEIDYRSETTYRFSAYIECPTPKNPGDLEYNALTAFALTFISWEEKKADTALRELIDGLEYAEEDMWLSYTYTDKMMIQYVAFEDALYISAYLI